MQQAIVLITLLIPEATKLTLGNYLIVFSHTQFGRIIGSRGDLWLTPGGAHSWLLWLLFTDSLILVKLPIAEFAHDEICLPLKE